MTRSSTSKVRSVLFLFLVINIIFFIVGMMIIGKNGTHVQRDIETALYVWFFLTTILAGVIWFFGSIFLQSGLRDVQKIITDISRGNFNIEFKLFEYDYQKNPEIAELISSLKRMVSAIQQLDRAKKEKIVEHMNRIQALLKLAENGFMVVSLDGYVRFINNVVTENFPQISEGVNLLEGHFPPEIENSVVRYVTQVLKTRGKLDSQQFFLPSRKRHIQLRTLLVKDEAAQITGAVFGIYNLEHKANDRLAEIENFR